jgi:pyrrolidone-carboxylate peptidase
VTAAVLPVTFGGSATAIEALVAQAQEPLTLLLGLGVHPGHSFRIEQRARRSIVATRPDTEGCRLAPDAEAAARETDVELRRAALAMALAGSGAVTLSRDAGRYVCERAYYQLLTCGSQRNAPTLFVHVPPVLSVDVARQAAVIRRFVQSSDTWLARKPVDR